MNSSDIVQIVQHWVETPVNAYLGSGYGSEIKAILHKPFNSGMADQVIQKLRHDVPLIGALPVSSLNMYATQRGAEGVDLSIDIAGNGVFLGVGQVAQ